MAVSSDEPRGFGQSKYATYNVEYVQGMCRGPFQWNMEQQISVLTILCNLIFVFVGTSQAIQQQDSHLDAGQGGRISVVRDQVNQRRRCHPHDQQRIWGTFRPLTDLFIRMADSITFNNVKLQYTGYTYTSCTVWINKSITASDTCTLVYYVSAVLPNVQYIQFIILGQR